VDGDYWLRVNGRVVSSFQRRFGDTDGDRGVGAADLSRLTATGVGPLQPSYYAFLDYNRDGRVNQVDRAAFARRAKGDWKGEWTRPFGPWPGRGPPPPA